MTDRPTGPAIPSTRDVVLWSLGRGQNQAESIGSLAERLTLPRREVERALQAIADEGLHPLCATGAGVFLATSEEELSGYLESLRHRALEIFRRYRGVKRARSAMRRVKVQQLEMFVA